ncbi:alpha-xylosidase [Tessaracoccus lapidicaptus]|uniref:alpha-xylosidase n=1 Tax=Tessaracoccus lapidicaptus TaxID=1427523 RepID=UPI00334061C2
MKFTDGYWQLRPGVTALSPRSIAEIVVEEGRRLVAHTPTRVIEHRGDTLNCPQLTISIDSPADGVIGVTIEHWDQPEVGPRFALAGAAPEVTVTEAEGSVSLTSGTLTATLGRDVPWDLSFDGASGHLTSSTGRAPSALTTPDGSFVREQLAISPGEHLFGLGERFGPLVKNGQSVEIWNADGGTSSEQAYKNVPFYLSDRGYGVFVDTPDHVSYELASEFASRAQFSVPGHRLRYLVIDGPTPADVLRRYTALTGRPARVPAWSYGLWLSTSFTTDYDEDTVNSFIDGMAERDLPMSVFHFDCFWMRAFHWTDLIWDPATFPDPEGMLARLHERGLKVSAWINPYIARRSVLYAEGKDLGYLVKRPDGSVWQWDMWQAGMALVDFTNPDATAWFVEKLRGLLRQGVDALKTDFGERIPTDVVWHDGSDPQRMHNYYAHLYNKAVFDLLVEERGEGDAVVFARSATAGGQQFPVHWGGDCESTFSAMSESLRGGLSLAASGFGFWSHDIGGFEGTPDPGVFKRWLAFGLLSSHSRLHGSSSYRVPWAFDDEAVDVARQFIRLKMRLMPYLGQLGEVAHTEGLPVMRPLFLEFPEDPGAAMVDLQYMLGDQLLVSPIFSDDGRVTYYVPAGRWTNVLDGAVVEGPGWRTEAHGFDSLPLLARPGAVIPWGAVADRPDYDWAEGVELTAYGFEPGMSRVVEIPRPDGSVSRFEVAADGGGEVSARLLDGSAPVEAWTLTVR